MARRALTTTAEAPKADAALKRFSDLTDDERWALVQRLAERFGLVLPEDGAAPAGARKR